MTIVRVDVVDSAEGRALIVIEGTGQQARVGRVTDLPGRQRARFWIEDAETEGVLEQTAANYAHAGRLFAIACGISGAHVVVDYED